MKSNGILSRYMRPGYSRGKFVQEAKGGESMDMAFKKKKRDFFNLNLDGVDYNTGGGDPKNSVAEFDKQDQQWYLIEPSKLNQKKIDSQEQWIFTLNENGEYDAVGDIGEVDFLFYDDRKDYQAYKNKQKIKDGYETVKALGSLGYNYAKGKELKDDVSTADTLKEYGKATGRTLVGGAKVLPEAFASAYRFLMPFEAVGGVGPIDTFKKDAPLKDDYYIPYYSDFIGGKDKAGQGVFPEFLKADKSLYQDNEFDNMITELNTNDDPTDDMITRDKFDEQIGGVGLGNALTLFTGATGPVRNISKLAGLKKIADGINKSKNLRQLDNPINQIGAGLGVDLFQDNEYDSIYPNQAE